MKNRACAGAHGRRDARRRDDAAPADGSPKARPTRHAGIRAAGRDPIAFRERTIVAVAGVDSEAGSATRPGADRLLRSPSRPGRPAVGSGCEGGLLRCPVRRPDRHLCHPVGEHPHWQGRMAAGSAWRVAQGRAARGPGPPAARQGRSTHPPDWCRARRVVPAVGRRSVLVAGSRLRRASGNARCLGISEGRPDVVGARSAGGIAFGRRRARVGVLRRARTRRDRPSARHRPAVVTRPDEPSRGQQRSAESLVAPDKSPSARTSVGSTPRSRPGSGPPRLQSCTPGSTPGSVWSPTS